MPITKKTGYAGRTFVSTDSLMEKQLGYSRAVRDGDWIFLSNTSGSDFERGFLPGDLVEQTRQMLVNVENALSAAGGTVEDIVRVVLYVSNTEYLPVIRPYLSTMIIRARPALTAVCAPLARPELKVEMEVTARVRG